MSGPLGSLPGMTFDPLRNRYFPTPKGPPPTPPPPAPGPPSRSRRFLRPPPHAQYPYTVPPTPTLTPSQPGPSNSTSRRVHWGTDTAAGSNSTWSGYGGIPFSDKPPGCFAPLGDRELYKGKRSAHEMYDGNNHSHKLDRIERMCKSRMGRRVARNERYEKTEQDILENLELKVTHDSCGCQDEIITSYKSCGPEAYLATTDHGKLIVHKSDGDTTIFSLCAQALLGVHSDIARLTVMAIAGGSEPHVHMFKRDPDNLNYAYMSHSDLALTRGDIYSMSSFDDICVLGGNKSLTVLRYNSESRIASISRPLHSDALAIHQSSSDLTHVGQRAGVVSLEDLRTAPTGGRRNIVAETRKGKAVVGVKRLDDAAVPWGLAVSGMGNELLLFDVRYGSEPLREFEGHVNTFLSNLSMTTSPNDKFIFASGSDRRIRGWSTLTGDPVLPPLYKGDREEDENPLNRVFENKVSHLAIRDDLGMDVVVRGDLLRYSRKGGSSMP